MLLWESGVEKAHQPQQLHLLLILPADNSHPPQTCGHFLRNNLDHASDSYHLALVAWMPFIEPADMYMPSSCVTPGAIGPPRI
jgi:hypothetical protein